MIYVLVMLGSLEMTIDKQLLERGYKKYDPTRLDNEDFVCRFQKRFDDEFGKKYFIDVLKWSYEFVPIEKRDKWWKPFVYEYETQICMHNDEKTINLHFYSSWNIAEVEQFMEKYFEQMQPSYYELWNGERRVRPQREENNYS